MLPYTLMEKPMSRSLGMCLVQPAFFILFSQSLSCEGPKLQSGNLLSLDLGENSDSLQ